MYVEINKEQEDKNSGKNLLKNWIFASNNLKYSTFPHDTKHSEVFKGKYVSSGFSDPAKTRQACPVQFFYMSAKHFLDRNSI